jgi:hypothetical protein
MASPSEQSESGPEGWQIGKKPVIRALFAFGLELGYAFVDCVVS